MRLDFAVVALSLLTSVTASVIEPHRHVERVDLSPADDHDLFKRRGGGGGGGKGGGGGGGGKSGGSKSSSSKSSKSSSKSSNTKTNSNSGGTSSSGSGPSRNFGNGRYYPGGAAVPYKAGSKTPGGIGAFLLLGGALAFWPGVWLYGAYMYHYDNHYRYYNSTSQKNETRDIICGCARFAVCGCNDNNDTSYYNQLIGNGSYDHLNKSIVNVAKVNGTETILINGTLPNGTTAQGEDSAAGDGMRSMVEALGWWPAVAAVMATVFLA